MGAEPEMRAVGRALNRLAETLEREEELRKESVADLSRELRTPVAGILGRIEAVEDGVLRLEEDLAAMHADSLRLTRVLDDLARLADAEWQGLLLDKAPLGLGGLATTVVQSFAQRSADVGIALTVRTESVWVGGDAGCLAQVISNLLSNALCYAEAGAMSPSAWSTPVKRRFSKYPKAGSASSLRTCATFSPLLAG